MSLTRRQVLGVLALLAAIVAALAPLSPEVVERWFSVGIYPSLQRITTSVTNVLPFAVLDVLLVLAVSTVTVAVVRGARQAIRNRTVGPIGHAAFAIASGVAVLYLVFLGLWGLNYRRIALPGRLVVDEGPVEPEMVTRLGLEAVRQLNALYAEAHRLGWNDPEWRSAALIRAAATVQTELTDASPAVPGRLKRSILGPYFRWTGVDGMVNPFGLEVLENPDLQPFERPFVAAHEWAHLAGFANESEANFVGFLTCIRASVPAQYSGWLYLYWQVAGETDGGVRARLWESMAEGPRTDVEAIIARLRRGERPRLRLASWMVYDTYLKANRVESGVRSYGEVVNLLVRARFSHGWVPIRKRGG